MKKVIIVMAAIIVTQLFVIVLLWMVNNRTEDACTKLLIKDDKLYEEKYNLRMQLNRERKRVDDEAGGDECPLCYCDSVYAPQNCIVSREDRRYICKKCGYKWGIYAYCFEK